MDAPLFSRHSIWTMAHGIFVGGGGLAVAGALFAMVAMRSSPVDTYLSFPPYRATPPGALPITQRTRWRMDKPPGRWSTQARVADIRELGAIRWLWGATAYVCAAMAILGVVIPGLPTTPFLLLAAWAASRGSRRLHDWLHAHPQLGPVLADWKENRAVSTVAKALASLFLVLSWLIMSGRDVSVSLLVPLGILFVCVLTFVVTRPRPNR